MQEVVFRFGRCEVNVARRQVVVDGEERALEPRPFEALLYLLEHRDRVISKDELLDQVWKQRHVSPGVISRVVSLIRKVIGDEGGDASLLRTVHGVGLRFVGAVTVHDANPLVQAPDATPPVPGISGRSPRLQPKALSLAVLPFDNLTGDPRLSWVEFGLSALTVRTLEQDRRLAMVSLPDLQKVLRAAPPGSDAAQRADVVARVLGADRVLHAQVCQDAEGFRLIHTLSGPPSASAERGTLQGPHLITLGYRLAGAVSVALSPAGTAKTVDFAAADPLSGQTFVRAMQAVGEQKHKQAGHLLRVALDMEPGHPVIRRELFACLSNIGDRSALKLGQALLDEAQAGGEVAQTAFVHHMLGRCYAINRIEEPARRHLDEALRLSESDGPWDWSPMALQYRFSLAVNHGEIGRAGQLLEVMRQSWQDSPNQCLRIAWLSNVSNMSWRKGNLVRALDCDWQVRQLSSECNLASDYAASSGSLAVASGELGLVRSAVRCGEEAVSAALALAEPTVIAPAACTLCWLYREIRRPSGSRRVVASLDSPEFRVAAGLPGLLMARGHHAAAERRYEDALGHWREAVAMAARLGAKHAEHVALPWFIVSLVQAGCADEARSQLDKSRVRPDIVEHPRTRAALAHCEAFRLHATGDRDAALAHLIALAEEAPQSHWRAAACIDGAWLHLEDGRLAPARRLMRDLGSWLDEHPVGLMLEARLLHAEGRSGAAAEQHGRALAAMESAAPGYAQELAAAYAAAAAAPLARWLPSRL